MQKLVALAAVFIAVSASPTRAQARLAAQCQSGEQQACAQLARSNATTELRLAAVRKLTDQSVLAELAKTCQVRRVRLEAIRGLIDQDALAWIAREAKGPVDRGAAIERLQDQELLAQIARKDSSGWVRRKAANCLADERQIAKLVAEDRKELLPTVTVGGGIRHVTIDGKALRESLLGVSAVLPGRHPITAEYTVKENVTWEDGSVNSTVLNARLGASYWLEAEVGVVTWEYLSPQTRRGQGIWKLVIREEVSSGPDLLPQLLRR